MTKPELAEHRAANYIRKAATCEVMKFLLNKKNITHRPIATTFGQGQLGNQMSTFASLYAIRREFGIYNFVGPHQLNAIAKAFDLPYPIKSPEDIDSWPYLVWDDSKHMH